MWSDINNKTWVFSIKLHLKFTVTAVMWPLSLDPKKVWAKIITFWVQKDFGSKIILGLKKIVGTNKLLVPNNFVSENNCVSGKKLW